MELKGVERKSMEKMEMDGNPKKLEFILATGCLPI